MAYKQGDGGATLSSGWRKRLWRAALIAALPAAFIYVHVRAHILYATVDIGMHRDDVIARLGQPRRVEHEVIFCAPYIPWSGACPERRRDGEFLHFKMGIDRWIILGVDQAGVVWFRTLGDT